MSIVLSENQKNRFAGRWLQNGFQKHLAMKLRDGRATEKICKAYIYTNLIDEIQFDVSYEVIIVSVKVTILYKSIVYIDCIDSANGKFQIGDNPRD